MASFHRHLIRQYSSLQQVQHSAELNELCYKYLLLGQYKQLSCRHWLSHQQHTTNWKISLNEQTFKLHSELDTSVKIPLQLLGTYSEQNESFIFANHNHQLLRQSANIAADLNAFCTKFPEITDWIKSKHGIFTQCTEHLPYLFGALMVAVMPNVHGYYVGSYPYGSGQGNADQTPQPPIVFILLSELDQYTAYNEKEHLLDLNTADLMKTWHFTFKIMCKECEWLKLDDNVKIFEQFFGHFDVECKKESNVIITDSKTGSAINVVRLTVPDNVFGIKNMDFDMDDHEIRRVNGMDLTIE